MVKWKCPSIQRRSPAIYLTSIDFPLDVFALSVGLMFLMWVEANMDNSELIDTRKVPIELKLAYSTQWNCDSILKNKIYYPSSTTASKVWTVFIIVFTCLSAILLVLRSIGVLPSNKELGILYLVAAGVVLLVIIVTAPILADDLQIGEEVKKKADWAIYKQESLVKLREIQEIRQKESRLAAKNRGRARRGTLQDDDDKRNSRLAVGSGKHYPCIRGIQRAPLCLLLIALYIILGLRCIWGSTPQPVGDSNRNERPANNV